MGNDYDADIRNFLRAWQYYLQRRGINDGKGYLKQLMREVNIIFKDVTRTITQGSGANAGICGSIYTGAQPNMSTCKRRCHEIASLMLYIKGYTYNIKHKTCQNRTVHAGTADQFTEYLRCTLATEVLLQVYGNNEDQREVIQKVAEALRQADKPGQQQYEPGACEDQDYGPVIFGLRGIAPSIQTKLHEWKKGLAGGQVGSARVTGQKCARPEQDRDQNSAEDCNENEGVITPDSEFMRKIKHWADTFIFGRVKQVLEDMQKEEASKETCEIQKKVKEKVQNVKKKVIKKTAAKPAPAKSVKPAPAAVKPVGTTEQEIDVVTAVFRCTHTETTSEGV
ncbi:hypothetical protein AK88_05411 [Plasmodium fragile]|uniref:Schizont-infected cell agglutination extracellular alpha domain-containing protein n=1 Tax=Plasmodium fragile TaxID=5857 RepID=A0A0D9QGV5_PLAFR|nr:uncharacterized protein AK88_05411 [Plasmodium fragile]KJP84956.1 hypothetical protein AK88_05411 [Plasmodium fragile]